MGRFNQCFPSTGRFISRDSYAGKIEDPLSLNLYTYCANNPIVYIDSSGHNGEAIKGVAIIVGLVAISTLYVAATTTSNPQAQQSFNSAANAIADGINKLNNIFNRLNITNNSNGGELSDTKAQFTTVYTPTDNPYLEKWSESFEQAKEDVGEKDVAITSSKKNYDPVIFPENPDDFNPAGMERYPYPTPNGMIYKWGYCRQTAIFEWDEDYKNGSHYHCMLPEWNNKHDECEEAHFKAGTVMPEPWATWYKGY